MKRQRRSLQAGERSEWPQHGPVHGPLVELDDVGGGEGDPLGDGHHFCVRVVVNTVERVEELTEKRERRCSRLSPRSS